MDTEDYKKIKINPIFEPIKKIYEFFILGTLFIGQKDIQQIMISHFPDLSEFISDYNKEVNLREEGRSVKSNAGLYLFNFGRLMAIAIFDILQFSKYHNLIKKDDIFKFSKHIRNGAAHDNRFNLNPPIKGQLRWRDKTITQSLDKSKLFPDFINPNELIILMSDISQLIKDKENKKT